MKHCYCGAWGEIWKSGEKEDKESSRSYEAVVLTKKKKKFAYKLEKLNWINFLHMFIQNKGPSIFTKNKEIPANFTKAINFTSKIVIYYQNTTYFFI